MEIISVLGCGWLGLPLADYLIEKGYSVNGSTTTPGKLDVMESRGIKPFYLVLEPGLRGRDIDDFFHSDVIVINFPPEKRKDIVEYHRAQISSLIAQIKLSPINKVLFVSSTSVYPNVNREVFEDEMALPEKASGKALSAVEKMLAACAEFKTTVLRFGGLIGYDRMPGRFLAGKSGISGGYSPVNLIHRDDCIRIINKIIELGVWGEVLNACADGHPLRKEYYVAQARKTGLEPPRFLESGRAGYKVVRSDRLKRLLGYEFEYPDPSDIAEG
jgi:nucleoside-diphosphate-sugar epimerase